MNSPGPVLGHDIPGIAPAAVLELIRDRYLAGVANAEAKYRFGEGDEDTLTGALGAEISTGRPWMVRTEAGVFKIEIEYWKLRGRGPNAPEKSLGADGSFQIKIADADGTPIISKGLPFQAKKNWKGIDKRLAQQARDMLNHTHGGIVVDFSPNGFAACDVLDVIEFRGNRKALSKAGKVNQLGQVLAHEFLACNVGVRDLYYDRNLERFVKEAPQADLNIVDTRITILSP